MPAGLAVAESVFTRLDPAIAFSAVAADGGWRDPGPLAEVSGSAAAILAGERVALNFLGPPLRHRHAHRPLRPGRGGHRRAHSRHAEDHARDCGQLEKEAVRAGGGTNHRLGLYDAVLVKENHAALAGGVGEATRRALAGSPAGVIVEVECASLDEVAEALAAGAGRLLLDNMAPEQLRRAVQLADGRAELEASGGVTLENVREVAEAGVEWISVGALTHSAPGARREPDAANPADAGLPAL